MVDDFVIHLYTDYTTTFVMISKQPWTMKVEIIYEV